MKTQIRPLPEDEESISLLTSLLVRYPELGTINFTPKGRLLKLGFFLKGEIEKASQTIYTKELIDAVSAYLYFENKTEPLFFKISYTFNSGITVVEITRDTDTLGSKEIGLIIEYLHNSSKLLSDEPFYFDDEDLSEEDDFIGAILDKLRSKEPKNKLIAVREEGRVLVFKR